MFAYLANRGEIKQRDYQSVNTGERRAGGNTDLVSAAYESANPFEAACLLFDDACLVLSDALSAYSTTTYICSSKLKVQNDVRCSVVLLSTYQTKKKRIARHEPHVTPELELYKH